MRRYVPLLIAGAALIGAACRDTVAPARSQEASDLSYLGDRSFASSIALYDVSAAVEKKFWIQPAGNTERLGEFSIKFDANAVCDPVTSGYGSAYWRKSCTPLGQPIEITARIFRSGDKSFLEFKPDIRFNPDVDVVVSATRKEIIGHRLTLRMILKYGIWYTKELDGTRLFVDEAWGDPELITHFNTLTGRVWREIRHFSGIVIHVGSCTDEPEAEGCGGVGQEN
jgi:hypothetical protein